MLNQCQFIGNLGRDPEIRTFSNGNKVCNLRLACSEKWKDKDGNKQEKTEWVSIAIFNDGLVRIAEQYLKKGSKIFVSGKLATRKYQAQDGTDRYSTEVVLQGFGGTLTMLDGREGGSQDGNQDNGGGQSGGYGGDNQGSYGAGGGPNSGGRSDMDDEIPWAPVTLI